MCLCEYICDGEREKERGFTSGDQYITSNQFRTWTMMMKKNSMKSIENLLNF